MEAAAEGATRTDGKVNLYHDQHQIALIGWESRKNRMEFAYRIGFLGSQRRNTGERS
jgi:hypothetical protein